MREKEHRITFYEYHDIETMTPEQAYKANQYASEAIERAQNLITYLQDYQKKLYGRFNELAAMEKHTRITLKRENRYYQNKIFYYITTEEVYSDGTTVLISSEKYEGKQRHQAITDFEGMKKAAPHIEYIKDIEKARWEK